MYNELFLLWMVKILKEFIVDEVVSVSVEDVH